MRPRRHPWRRWSSRSKARSEPWKGPEGIFRLAVEEHWATLDPYSVALAMIGPVPRPARSIGKEGLR